MVLQGIVWKSHKTLIFQSSLSSLRTAYVHPYSLIKELCGSSPRRGVFSPQRTQRLRRGRRGFASFAQGRRRLRVKLSRLVTARPSQRTRSPCVLCEAFAPIALQKHRNAVKKHANFFSDGVNPLILSLKGNVSNRMIREDKRPILIGGCRSPQPPISIGRLSSRIIRFETLPFFHTIPSRTLILNSFSPRPSGNS
jgi:hypothetical protein